MEILTDIASKIGFEWHLALTHLINFLIIFFLLVKFALPSIKKTISERTKKIEEGLKMREDADKIVEDANKTSLEINKLANKKAEDMFSKAENSAKEIVSAAHLNATSILQAADKEKEGAKMKGLQDAENLFTKDIANILAKVSANAFSTKVTADVNKDFISKVFKIN